MATNSDDTWPKHSVAKDLAIGAGWATGVLSAWAAVWFADGNGQATDDSLATVGQVCAATLTLASLLSRQYLQGEVLTYLKTVHQLSGCLRDAQALAIAHGANVPRLVAGAAFFARHERYVLEELKILGLVPMVMITALGVALLAKTLALVASAVFVLLTLVLYMVRCTTTSVDVAAERLELDDLVNETRAEIDAMRSPPT